MEVDAGHRRHRLRWHDVRGDPIEPIGDPLLCRGREQHAPHRVRRCEQPLDRRQSFDDEVLVASLSAVTNLVIVGKPRIAGSSTLITARLYAAALRTDVRFAKMDPCRPPLSTRSSSGSSVSSPSKSPCIDDLSALDRTWIDDTTWIDYAPQWMHGADQVFSELVHHLPWKQREVIMYDRRLDEPRLTSWWDTNDDEPEPLQRFWQRPRSAFTRHYGKQFDSIGYNLYRDGHDSVAWHGDRMRHFMEDPIVAIVSTGEPWPFHLRPRGGGASRTWQLGQGDLFVMGGSCQHDWEHSVPKVAHAGPRLSIMFRHDLADSEVRDWGR